VLVLRDSQGANPACAGLASVRLSSEGGAVWGYSVPMPLLPPVAYFEALKARVGAACPHLSG